MDNLEEKVNQVRKRLIQARKQSGLNQTQVARILGYTSASGISNLETDYRPTEPTISRLYQLANIYDVSIVWLLTGKNPNFNEVEFDMLTQATNATIEEIHKLKNLLESLKQSR